MLGEYVWEDERGRVWHYSSASGGQAMAFKYPLRYTQTGDLPIPDPLLVQAGPMRRSVPSDLPLAQNPQDSA